MRVAPAVAAALLALLAMLAAAPFGTAQDAPAGEPRAVVLLHHPFDRVDPFGVPFGAACPPDASRCPDTFSARRGANARAGQFDFPTFVADGVLAVHSVPDPEQPFVSTLANYTARVEERLVLGSPGTLSLQARAGAAALDVTIAFQPTTDLSDPQAPEALHLVVAVVEDFIHYQPDARVSNGVDDHRFTVRALADTGSIEAGRPTTRNQSFALPTDWKRADLVVAAWVEAQGASRYREGEVLQAAWGPADGTETVQRGKAVLVEVYSATWCDPCLFGDMAAEALAVSHGGADKAPAAAGPKYFREPGQPLIAAGAGLGAGLAAWVLAARRRAS